MANSLEATDCRLKIAAALRSYKQADHDGVMVLVSRQACDEAADILEAPQPESAAPDLDDDPFNVANDFLDRPRPSEKNGEGRTPRTDALDHGFYGYSDYRRAIQSTSELFTLCRQLERELVDANGKVAYLLRRPVEGAAQSATAPLDLLKRIRQWDMLDTAADGPYWKREIDAALSSGSAKEGKDG